MKIKQNWQKTPMHRKVGHLLVYLAGVYSSAVMMTEWNPDVKSWNIYFAGVVVGLYQAGIKFLFDDDLNLQMSKPTNAIVDDTPKSTSSKKDIEI